MLSTKPQRLAYCTCGKIRPISNFCQISLLWKVSKSSKRLYTFQISFYIVTNSRWRTSPLGQIREYLCVWPQIDSWVHLLYNGMMVGNKKGRRYLQTIFGWPKRSLKMALLEHNLRVIFQSIWGFLTMWGKVLSKQDNILQILLLKQNTISYCFLIYWEMLLFSFFLHNYCIINHFMLFENKEWETFLSKVTDNKKLYCRIP